jgi:hypothetical protein
MIESRNSRKLIIMIKLSIDTLYSSPEQMACVEVGDNRPCIPLAEKNKIFVLFLVLISQLIKMARLDYLDSRKL